MKKRFADYQWLAGNARHGSLWAGPDHLLYIETTSVFFAMSERYKRIDFAKIQAVSYGRTTAFVWLLLMWLGLIGLFSWLAARAWEDQPGGYILAGIAGVMVVGLIAHVVRGATAVCSVQTAVQVLRLKPIKRESQARALLERLAPLCRLHQGEVGDGSDLPLNASSSQVPGSELFGLSGIKPPFSGSKTLTWALLAALLSGCAYAGEMFVNNPLYSEAQLWFLGVAFILVVVGFGMASRMALPTSLKVSLWGQIVTMIVGGGVSYAIFVMGMFTEMTGRFKQGEVTTPSVVADLSWVAKASFEELGWVAWVVVATGALIVVFALLGLPAVLRPPAQAMPVAMPPPLPVAPRVTVPAEPDEDSFPLP